MAEQQTPTWKVVPGHAGRLLITDEQGVVVVAVVMPLPSGEAAEGHAALLANAPRLAHALRALAVNFRLLKRATGRGSAWGDGDYRNAIDSLKKAVL
jgi:hypothetical protein